MTQALNMYTRTIEGLLDDFRKIRKQPRETTLFEIGGRGHYENPISDLLAFFLNPQAEHRFAGEVLSALLSVLPASAQPDPDDWYLIGSPRREWVTSSQKRIDLVLESDRWVLVLENKVFHTLDNDLVEYGEDTQARIAAKGQRRLIRVVLSPSGETNSSSGWIGLPYGDVVMALKARLGRLFVEHAVSKWLIFLREFVLHLENTTMTETISDEQQEFVLERLGEVKALVQVKDRSLQLIRERLASKINNFLAQYGVDVESWQDNWPEGPAMRFKPSEWSSESVLTLHLPFETPGVAQLICYIDLKAGDPVELKRYGFSPDAYDDTDVDQVTRLFKKNFGQLDWEHIAGMLSDNLYRLIYLEQPWMLDK